MHTRHTLSLNAEWDIYLTDVGNIALTYGVYATAQNVGNECRMFTRDAYFQQQKGVPHYLVDLGSKLPAKPLLRSYLRQAALRVADVMSIDAIELEDFDKTARRLTGNIFFTTLEGENVDLSV
jgi:hypothetical protein